jgi:hypothetical protein
LSRQALTRQQRCRLFRNPHFKEFMADNTHTVKTEKERLIRLLERQRQQSIAALRDVDERAVVHEESGWRVQDLLGHLAAWEREALAAIQAFTENERYTLGDEYQLDLYNEENYLKRKSYDAAQCRMDWGMVRRDLQFAIYEVPDDRFFDAIRFPWGAEGTIAELVEDMVKHEEEHLGEIVAGITSRR